jgi:ubiquinone/menaquinone biosynthesis C-methylase UbiE
MPQDDKGGWPGKWSDAWEEARASLLHVSNPVEDERWRAYWNKRSDSYMGQVAEDMPLLKTVIGFMAREGLLTPKDEVLDVGCGSGPYTLLFARAARSITALDISQGMLDELVKRASAGGIRNIRTVCSSWENYRGRKKYDLVFSSFCPGVDNPQALFKMERMCRRSCCYITSGSVGQPGYMYELWKMLTGECSHLSKNDDFYAFNILYEAGRMPNVRSFHHHSQKILSQEEIVSNALLYFEMLMPLDEKQKRMIRGYVSSHLPEDTEEGADRSLHLVYWQPE